MTRLRILVSPASAWSARPRLFDALEEAFPVRFEAANGAGAVTPDGVVRLGPADPVSPFPRGVPALYLDGGSPPPTTPRPGTVSFSRHPALRACLRGATLRDDHRGGGPGVSLLTGDAVLAASEVPLLAIREEDGSPTLLASAIPEELSDREGLRDRLRDGRFLELLPLVQFLGDLVRRAGWEEPGLRAAFMVDDPNLHGASYGFLRFADVARHAREHRYHLTIAMVPLDTWFTHPAGARIFRENPGQLSILMHGNNHVREELGQPWSREEARRLLAQALRRSDRFERQTGIPVSPIMSAPHNACSELMVEEMVRLGFEGLSFHQPYPWTETPPTDPALVDWWPAELIGPGLPVLHRLSWGRPRDPLVLRALLHHPLVIFGHHQDFARGLEPFGEQADRMNSWGDVHWMSLGDMARSNFARRVEGRTLCLRLYSRRIRVTIPPGVDEAILEIPLRSDPAAGPDSAVLAGERGTFRAVPGSVLREAGPFPVTPGQILDLRVEPPALLDPFTVPSPGPRPWPFLRRVLTEGRDRMLPAIKRYST